MDGSGHDYMRSTFGAVSTYEHDQKGERQHHGGTRVEQ